jgi:hypothetical protein
MFILKLLNDIQMKSKNMPLNKVTKVGPPSPPERERGRGRCLLLLLMLFSAMAAFSNEDSLRHALTAALNGGGQKENGFFIKADNSEFNQAWFDKANEGSPLINDYKKNGICRRERNRKDE